MLHFGVVKQRILVTGANGLLGKSVIAKLSIENTITALVRQIPTTGKVTNVNYIQIDLSSDWQVSSLPDQMDVVIHVAQSNRYKDFPSSALEVFNVNLASTMKLLEYGRNVGIKKFIFASTGGLYAQNRLPLTEDSEIFSPDKLTHYLGTKFSSEVFATNYRPFFNVDILRIFFMYGPGQKSNMLIPRLISSVKQEIAISLAGASGIKLNPIFVEDVVDIISSRLIATDSQVFNVAGQEVLTLKYLCEIIGRITGKSPIFEIKGEQPDLVSEFLLCSEILGRAGTSLGVGLSSTIDWFDAISDNRS